MDYEKLLTPSEVAAMFRVDPKTVTRWADKFPKVFPSIRTPGGHRRFRQSDIEAILSSDGDVRDFDRL